MCDSHRAYIYIAPFNTIVEKQQIMLLTVNQALKKALKFLIYLFISY